MKAAHPVRRVRFFVGLLSVGSERHVRDCSADADDQSPLLPCERADFGFDESIFKRNGHRFASIASSPQTHSRLFACATVRKEPCEITASCLVQLVVPQLKPPRRSSASARAHGPPTARAGSSPRISDLQQLLGRTLRAMFDRFALIQRQSLRLGLVTDQRIQETTHGRFKER